MTRLNCRSDFFERKGTSLHWCPFWHWVSLVAAQAIAKRENQGVVSLAVMERWDKSWFLFCALGSPEVRGRVTLLSP